MRPPSRRIVPAVLLAAAGAGAIAAPTASAALPSGWRFFLQIEDNVALPGQQLPDRVLGGYSSDVPFPGPGTFPDGRDVLTVERAGTTIGTGYGSMSVERLDLRDGDQFVFRRSGEPGRPEVARFTYRALPRLDAPVCAGEAAYGGVLDDRSTEFIEAEAVFWQPVNELPPVPTDDPLGNYPGGMAPPWAGYPGEYPGFGAKERIAVSATIDAPRFTVTPSRPLLAGTHLYVRSILKAPSFAVSSRVDRVVVDCTVPTPAPTPPVTTPTPSPDAVAPTPTPVPQSQPVSKPSGDVTPPTATFSLATSRELRKLGLTKLVRGGLPVRITSDEPARLVGTLTLLGGPQPFVSTIDRPIIKGITLTEFQLSPALRKRLAKVRRAKLRVELSLIDAAGNRTRFPAAAVRVPRR